MPAGAARGKELKSIADKILHFLFNRLQLGKLGKTASQRSEEMHTHNCRVQEGTGFGMGSFSFGLRKMAKGYRFIPGWGVRDEGQCSHDE